MSPDAPIGRRIAALAAALAVIAPSVAGADDWIIEPTPEATGAVASGAEEVGKAQKLARQKMYDEAAILLEGVARNFPASEHDCNLALAYMRKDDLTRAQLMVDVAELRGGARPDWCTSSLPQQLAQALRDQDYVPLTVNTTPADAVIVINELMVRGVHLFWLPVSTYKIVARADGYEDAKSPILVGAPNAELTLTLKAVEAAVEEPDDAVVDDSGDLGDVDLRAIPEPGPERPPPGATPPRPSWPGWVGVVGGGAFLALGAGFHLAALGTKDDANAIPNDTPMFDSLSSTFSRERAVAIGSYVIGTAAISVGIWWLTHASGEKR